MVVVSARAVSELDGGGELDEICLACHPRLSDTSIDGRLSSPLSAFSSFDPKSPFLSSHCRFPTSVGSSEMGDMTRLSLKFKEGAVAVLWYWLLLLCGRFARLLSPNYRLLATSCQFKKQILKIMVVNSIKYDKGILIMVVQFSIIFIRFLVSSTRFTGLLDQPVIS